MNSKIEKDKLLNIIYNKLGLLSFMDLVPLDRIEKAIESDKKFRSWSERVGVISMIEEYKRFELCQ